MILDTLAHRSSYRDLPELSLVLEYLAAITPENFPDRRAELLPPRVFVNPSCFVTRPEAECRFEAHRRCADVHCVVEGCERITVADIARTVPQGPFDPERDIGFYDCREGTVCVLRPGDFLVCFPQDAHRVGAAAGEAAPVRKLVAKILL
jgi:YhcH/YjgK/YiaL family protein